MGKIAKSVIKKYINNIHLNGNIVTLNNYSAYLYIEHSFTWINTAEGYDYWKRIYQNTSINDLEKALRSYLIEQNKIFIYI